MNVQFFTTQSCEFKQQKITSQISINLHVHTIVTQCHAVTLKVYCKYRCNGIMNKSRRRSQRHQATLMQQPCEPTWRVDPISGTAECMAPWACMHCFFVDEVRSNPLRTTISLCFILYHFSVF